MPNISNLLESWKTILTSILAALIVIPSVGDSIMNAWAAWSPKPASESIVNINYHGSILSFLSYGDTKNKNFHAFLKASKRKVILHATSFNITLESEQRQNEILDALRRGGGCYLFCS